MGEGLTCLATCLHFRFQQGCANKIVRACCYWLLSGLYPSLRASACASPLVALLGLATRVDSWALRLCRSNWPYWFHLVVVAKLATKRAASVALEDFLKLQPWQVQLTRHLPCPRPPLLFPSRTLPTSSSFAWSWAIFQLCGVSSPRVAFPCDEDTSFTAKPIQPKWWMGAARPSGVQGLPLPCSP